MSQTDRVLNPSVTRTWTIATWLLADPALRPAIVTDALVATGADAIALQSVRSDDAATIASGLRMQHRWSLSHYQRSPLLRGSGVGLAILTPHALADTESRIVSERRTTWSRKRRIAQAGLVRRADHSAYRIVHAVPLLDDLGSDPNSPPTVVIRPAHVDVDAARAVALPAKAVSVSSTITRPVPHAPALLVVTFDLEWVAADFPAR